MTKATGKGRGGRRPGAGAKKDNLNALRHGRYSTDDGIQALLARMDAETRRLAMPYLRASNRTIKRRLAWIRSARKGGPKVIPFPSSGLPSQQQQHAERSNGDRQPDPDLLRRMAGHNFYGARGFLLRHSPVMPVIDNVVDYFDSLDDRAYAGLRNPGGAIKAAIHEELAEADGAGVRCPYCSWRSSGSASSYGEA